MKDDFFNQKEIKKLRKVAGGDTYTIIYLKLLLLSLKDEGRLYFDGIEDSFAEELALTLDEDVENVKMTIAFLISVGLMRDVNPLEAYLTQLPELVGSESASAGRVRKHRERLKALESEQSAAKNCTEINSESLLCNSDVTRGNTDKEKEIEQESEEDADFKVSVHEIVTYLNEMSGTEYKPTSEYIKTLVHARLEEGFTIEDFKTVIFKKTKEWSGTDMAKYIRPQTLFGTKFESYLNQIGEVSWNKHDAIEGFLKGDENDEAGFW